MERVATDASRVVGRVLGRTREEIDDIWAEAVNLRDRWREPTSTTDRDAS